MTMSYVINSYDAAESNVIELQGHPETRATSSI